MKIHSIKSEKGLTLVELLAVLAISGIILTLVTNVMITGLNNIQKDKRVVELQNEANYIMTKISTTYYSTTAAETFSLTFEDVDSNGYGNIVLNNETISSASFKYRLDIVNENVPPDIYHLTLTVINEKNEEVTVRTTLQRYEIDYHFPGD